jgi:predicted Zn-dependent protease
MNRDAAERLVEGRNAEAIEMFQKAIQAFPDSATAYLNLAFAQSRIGQHKASADSLQKMLSQNISDSFLVSWSLAREYRSLGDSETSLRHEVVYLQNVDLALREAVDATLE